MTRYKVSIHKWRLRCIDGTQIFHIETAGRIGSHGSPFKVPFFIQRNQHEHCVTYRADGFVPIEKVTDDSGDMSIQSDVFGGSTARNDQAAVLFGNDFTKRDMGSQLINVI